MIYYIFFVYLLQYSSSLIFLFFYIYIIVYDHIWNIYYNTITAWRSVSIKSNTRYKSLLFSAFIIFNNLTIFSWPFNSYKNITSLNVLYASVALWKASKTFFKATIFFFILKNFSSYLFIWKYHTYFNFLSTAFHTIPYAPLPSFCIISNFLEICGSISSAITKLFFWF